jgi:hypothetical protein
MPATNKFGCTDNERSRVRAFRTSFVSWLQRRGRRIECTLWLAIALPILVGIGSTRLKGTLMTSLGDGSQSLGAIVRGGQIFLGYGRWYSEIWEEPANSFQLLPGSYWFPGNWYSIGYGRLKGPGSLGWSVHCPCWLLSTVPASLLLLVRRIRGGGGVKGICPNCGYDKRGFSICPECGR